MATFAELGLNPAILKAIEAAGYTEPTEVQIQAVPAAIAGADCVTTMYGQAAGSAPDTQEVGVANIIAGMKRMA